MVLIYYSSTILMFDDEIFSPYVYWCWVMTTVFHTRLNRYSR